MRASLTLGRLAAPRLRAALAVAIGATLVAGISAGAFNFLEGRGSASPMASVRSLALGPAPAPLERPEPPPPTFVEPATAEEAVSMFLQAESGQRFDLSYALLDTRSRRDYPVLASWVADQAGRPRPVRVSAARGESEAGSSTVRVPVRVDVAREPAVDPFVGFIAAQAAETWLARLDGGKWRVQDRPAGTDPQLPPDADAVAVAESWIGLAQECDSARAVALQVQRVLYGVADLAESLCGANVDGLSGGVAEFEPDAEGAGALAAFGPGIDVWARVVDVDAEKSFRLTLAPLGSRWRVLAISPLSREVSA